MYIPFEFIMFWMVVILLCIISIMEGNIGAALGALSFAVSGLFFAFRGKEKR